LQVSRICAASDRGLSFKRVTDPMMREKTMMRERRLVYVSGAPGAGKTSLAGPLAAALGYALLTKDAIKETLHDALGAPEPDLAWSQRLGGASMELLWTLAAIHCRCPAEVALSRYNARPRHPVHVKKTLPIEAMAEFDVPVGIGALITVDTTAPVDVAAVAAEVRAYHALG
jgi:hypothetical protein